MAFAVRDLGERRVARARRSRATASASRRRPHRAAATPRRVTHRRRARRLPRRARGRRRTAPSADIGGLVPRVSRAPQACRSRDHRRARRAVTAMPTLQTVPLPTSTCRVDGRVAPHGSGSRYSAFPCIDVTASRSRRVSTATPGRRRHAGQQRVRRPPGRACATRPSRPSSSPRSAPSARRRSPSTRPPGSVTTVVRRTRGARVHALDPVGAERRDQRAVAVEHEPIGPVEVEPARHRRAPAPSGATRQTASTSLRRVDRRRRCDPGPCR